MKNSFEIERKFLVKQMPINLDNYPKLDIFQAYLSFTDPCIRIRSANSKYYMTLKKGMGIKRNELEKEIDISVFNTLKDFVISNYISKTRYIIEINNEKIELDIYHKELDGLVLVEVEFASLEEAEQFKIPDWFGKEVTNDINYTNSSLSKKGLAE